MAYTGNIKSATKEVYESALKELLKKYPLSKISIVQITEQSRSSRQAFYYHFRDKYDLVAWIFSRDAEVSVNLYPDNSWFDVIAGLFKVMLEKKSFYRKVMADHTQNSLVEYMVEFDVGIYKKMLETAGIEVEEGSQLAFDISFHAYACVHMTHQWVLNGMKETPEMMATRLLNAMPKDLYNVIPSRGI